MLLTGNCSDVEARVLSVKGSHHTVHPSCNYHLVGLDDTCRWYLSVTLALTVTVLKDFIILFM